MRVPLTPGATFFGRPSLHISTGVCSDVADRAELAAETRVSWRQLAVLEQQQRAAAVTEAISDFVGPVVPAVGILIVALPA